MMLTFGILNMLITKYRNWKYFLAIVLIVLLGYSVDNFGWFTSDRISAISTLVIATFTVLLAIFTYQLRTDQKQQLKLMHEQSIRPLLNFYHSTDEPIKIHLENKGVAPAINIKITVSEPTQIGVGSDDKKILALKVKEAFEDNSILNRNILSLGPNQEMIKPLRIEELFIWNYQARVTIEFENIEGKKYFTISHLDFSGLGEYDY